MGVNHGATVEHQFFGVRCDFLGLVMNLGTRNENFLSMKAFHYEEVSE